MMPRRSKKCFRCRPHLYFFDVTLRGLTRIIPALEAYIHRPPRPTIDGGYYTKTRENRPLIGPTGPRGSFVMGAFSGYGIMAACGAADLLAAYISGEALPAWAAAFTRALRRSCLSRSARYLE